MEPSEKIIVKDIDDLPEAAEKILKMIGDHKIVLFRGGMGAGKTTLIREMCHKMGVEDYVASPTFAIINEYHDRNGHPVYHFDFYRIEKLEEAFDFGYEEYFYSGNLCFIEWPEKIEELLPEEFALIEIETDENDEEKRILKVTLVD